MAKKEETEVVPLSSLPYPYLDLWKEKTKEGEWKKANNGRFDFTAIDAHHQLFKATKMWGPYGERWGIKNIRITVIDCDPAVSWLLEGVFFYPSMTVTGKTVEFEYAIDLKYNAGFDMSKRLLTAFRSKCLSLLGFNADVYFNKFSDPEYIKEGKQRNSVLEKFARQINKAQSYKELEDLRSRIHTAAAGDTIGKDGIKDMEDEIEARIEYLRMFGS